MLIIVEADIADVTEGNRGLYSRPVALAVQQRLKVGRVLELLVLQIVYRCQQLFRLSSQDFLDEHRQLLCLLDTTK